MDLVVLSNYASYYNEPSITLPGWVNCDRQSLAEHFPAIHFERAHLVGHKFVQSKFQTLSPARKAGRKCELFCGWLRVGLIQLLILSVASLLFVENGYGWQDKAAKTNKDAPANKTDSSDEDSNSEDELGDALAEILEGHSIHGDAFNEGPRQSAYLMGGTGNVKFPVTTQSKEAQAFINQGVGQLHGFWYLEAERSFRQAAAIDPRCAMAYWGAAMATTSKRKRSQGFIAKAVELKEELDDLLTERERLLIEALERYLKDEKKKDKKGKSKRAQAYLKDLESISLKYPDDIEIKAFVAHRIWYNSREGIPVSSFLATNALLDQIYAAEPLHPANHYSIHLWDTRNPETALRAAARCGVAAPGIAHMWHMPGHIYSRLKRYTDAVFQQEAAARVDHAHMMRDQVMPDQIHNFAHNNEWLIRNLVFVGRANDALDLARNMTELPRHPKYNMLVKKKGSASYGRRRLLQVLREFQLYEQAVEITASPGLVEKEIEAEHVKLLRLRACAAAMLDESNLVGQIKSELGQLLSDKNAEFEEVGFRIAGLDATLDKSADRPPRPRKIKKPDRKKAKLHLKEAKAKLAKLKQLIDQIEKSQLAIDGYMAYQKQEFGVAFKKLEKATGEDVSLLAELQFMSGKHEDGLKKLADQVKRRPQEVIPLARQVFLQYQNGDIDLAKKTFEKLRTTSSSMDQQVELFSRLDPIAKEFGYDSPWLANVELASDLGFRPPLDSLGPFRWSPWAAPKWSLKDSAGKSATSSEYQGQPHLIIFYLGHGCLHCAEQLQAFAPRVKDFEDAGIKMIAISTDDQKGLLQSIKDFSGEIPMRLAADSSNEVFKKFRAFDDFEDQPLHGTFLIDGDGKVRWQDIGYEPFMEHEFLLKESQRLLDSSPAEPSVPDQARID